MKLFGQTVPGSSLYIGMHCMLTAHGLLMLKVNILSEFDGFH